MVKTWKKPSCPPGGEWINKLGYIRILFSAQQNWPVKTWEDMEETEMHITKWKEVIWKGYGLDDSNILGKAKPWDGERISTCPGLGGGRNKYSEHRGSLGQ